ncbi:MAG: M20/M25/M40 family metallo-hydrolase [Caldilineales bacterium]|nr:M20/M25/M40 family metallo-hydrolase [Caldilineales bacterium]
MTPLTTALLRRLSEAAGGPGNEGAVRDLIARALHPHVDALHIDAMGNLTAIKRGRGEGDLRVALTAHMDEVALFITEIDSNGLLHVAASGGVNARTLAGKGVLVGPEQLPGVIGWPPPHLQRHNNDESKRVPKIEDLVIDIGAADKEAAAARVKIGQQALFATRFGFLGRDQAVAEEAPLPQKGRIKGKAFDDRLGCAAAMALLMGPALPCDLHAIFTVQEEVGVRGALAAAEMLAVDLLLVLEGTVCDDLPGPVDEPRFPTTRLGDGPALTQRDGSYVVQAAVLQHLLRTAAAHGIPYQFKHPNAGGTDASGFGRYRATPTGILSTPCRYIHGPVAVAELGDFHALIQLLRAVLADEAALARLVGRS